MCKVYTGYHGTSEVEHSLCACTVDNPLAKARGLSRGLTLRTGAQTMLYLSLTHLLCHIMCVSVSSHLIFLDMYLLLEGLHGPVLSCSFRNVTSLFSCSYFNFMSFRLT